MFTITIHTERKISEQELQQYRVHLLNVGVPLSVVNSLIDTGRAEWTSLDVGGPVTTTYTLKKA